MANKTSMTKEAASRIQSATSKASKGTISKGSFAARASKVASKTVTKK